MRKFQRLLFVLKWSYICYYIFAWLYLLKTQKIEIDYIHVNHLNYINCLLLGKVLDVSSTVLFT